MNPVFAVLSDKLAGEVRPDEIRALGRQWLAVPYGTVLDEPGYMPVLPKLMVERTITTDAGERPAEVRFFMFDGKCAVINTVFIEDDKIRNGAFHKPDWTRLDWHFSRFVNREFPRPKRLADMLAIAERLAAGLDHVGVDFYDCVERIYIGEMTLYSWTGWSRFNPDSADFSLDAHWRIRHRMLRMACAVLFGRRRISKARRDRAGIQLFPPPS